jgi:hypothetical protein
LAACLLGLALLFATTPAEATGGLAPRRSPGLGDLAVSASSPRPLYAGILSYFSSLATRSRVIQWCFVAMCLALFIIMKKFAPAQCSGKKRGTRRNADSADWRGSEQKRTELSSSGGDVS